MRVYLLGQSKTTVVQWVDVEARIVTLRPRWLAFLVLDKAKILTSPRLAKAGPPCKTGELRLPIAPFVTLVVQWTKPKKA